MNNSPPRPSMGRGRGTPNRKKTPDKQKSKGQAAIEAQWATDPDLNQTFDSGRTSTENPRSPRRTRDNFQPSGLSPPSKSQKPNNTHKEIIQQVRANLRPTFLQKIVQHEQVANERIKSTIQAKHHRIPLKPQVTPEKENLKLQNTDKMENMKQQMSILPAKLRAKILVK